MINGVLFDMDGVLFDTERLGLTGWRLAAGELGVPMTDTFIAALRGRNIADSREYFNRTLGRDDYDAVRAIRVAYSDAIIAKEGVPVKPGVTELLEALKARHIPAVLATGTRREVAMRYLRETGIDGYFAAAICGDEVLHAKPDPEIYVRAAEKLGLTPGECMVLEDSINGLTAARAAGCVSVMVPDLTPPTPEIAPLYDFCVGSLVDVIPLLDGGAGGGG